jgi:hypothetical protein
MRDLVQSAIGYFQQENIILEILLFVRHLRQQQVPFLYYVVTSVVSLLLRNEGCEAAAAFQ